MIYYESLYHHGILGQKWGRTNGPPYPLDSGRLSSAERRQQKKIDKKDTKWAHKNHDKIYKSAFKSSKEEIDSYVNNELAQKYYAQLQTGKISKSFANEYNQRLALLMTQASSDLKAPSGKAVKFVAKRGEVGVYMALADEGYDMSQLKNGVWSTSGRIAYKKKTVDMA